MISFTNPIVQIDLQEISRRIKESCFDNKSILVTGGNSMLGTYTAFLFLYLAKEKGVNVKTIVLTRSLDPTLKIYKDFLGKGCFDIIHNDVAKPFHYDGNIDFIFHFAGNASPYFINNNPVDILKSNLIGTFNIMEIARIKHAKVIFASTREVYGAIEASMIPENQFGWTNPMDNRSCYPESKRAAESILRTYFIQYGVPSISARIAHCYGPGMKIENDGRVMSDFIGDAIQGKDIILNSSGDAIRAFCYISDVITALLLLATDGESGTAYNVSNESEPYPIADIAKIICDIEHKNSLCVRFNPSVEKSGYCAYKRVALDNSRIEALGFKPNISLREGIKRTLNSFDYEKCKNDKLQ